MVRFWRWRQVCRSIQVNYSDETTGPGKEVADSNELFRKKETKSTWESLICRLYLTADWGSRFPLLHRLPVSRFTCRVPGRNLTEKEFGIQNNLNHHCHFNIQCKMECKKKRTWGKGEEHSLGFSQKFEQKMQLNGDSWFTCTNMNKKILLVCCPHFYLYNITVNVNRGAYKVKRSTGRGVTCFD